MIVKRARWSLAKAETFFLGQVSERTTFAMTHPPLLEYEQIVKTHTLSSAVTKWRMGLNIGQIVSISMISYISSHTKDDSHVQIGRHSHPPRCLSLCRPSWPSRKQPTKFKIRYFSHLLPLQSWNTLSVTSVQKITFHLWGHFVCVFPRRFKVFGGSSIHWTAQRRRIWGPSQMWFLEQCTWMERNCHIL